MTLNILNEQRISIVDLARREKVSRGTMWRWILKGIRGQRLETILIGGKRYTSEERFIAFIKASTEASSMSPVPAKTHSVDERNRAIKASKAILLRAGIDR